jgi:hypothetical protein
MKNKIVAITTLALLTLLSFGKNIIYANADEPVPSDYDYAYKQDFSDFWRVENRLNSSLVTYDNPVYTRTGVSAPYDYTYTGSVELPFSVTMTFLKSDSSWQSSGGGYRPGAITDTYIGRTTSYTSAIIGIDLTFTNDTGYAYYLYLDYETAISLNVITTGYANNTMQLSRSTGTGYYTLAIPSFATTRIQTSNSTGARQFNAWYLTRLSGLNINLDVLYDNAYGQGFNDGQDNAITGNISFFSIFSGVMDSVAAIFSIEILGSITLGSLALFPLLGIMVLFFKKVIQ